MAASPWNKQGPPPMIGAASPIIADLLLRAADGVFAVVHVLHRGHATAGSLAAE